ncbi:MAG: hypothetical protein ACXVDJ_02335 [Tumebacillaceae bacterium]
MEQHDLPQAQPPQQNNAKVFVILGWIFAALTIFFNFFMFIPALVMGILAIVKGAKTQGILIIVLSVVLLIITIIVGGMVMNWLIHNAPMDPNLQHQ